MNFNFSKVTAILLSLVVYTNFSAAEEMPESAAHKEARIEGDLTALFNKALKASAMELAGDHEMSPFAIIKKQDGTLGFFSPTEKNEGMSVDQKAASVRSLLIDLASTQQINASIQSMFVTVSNDMGESNQGLVFEIEHREGVSLMRFIPVSETLDETGNKTGELTFDMAKLSTGSKPVTVFAPLNVQ